MDHVQQVVEIITLMRHTTFELRNQLNNMFLDRLGMTLPQVIVLRVINRLDRPTFGLIAQEVHLAPSTLSGIIKRLERESLLGRHPDPKDLRVQRITVSPKGQALIDGAEELYQSYIKEKFRLLTAGELAQLEELLKKLYDLLLMEPEGTI
ncbi:MAG: MarR family winged helix-turn-helix transcriptional regulator [Limnochordia bacterium]|jgi:DNA-binding MarR family transcriptional regulator